MTMTSTIALRILTWLMPLSVLLSGTAALAAESAMPELTTFVKKHCARCHNAEKLKGKLNLEPFAADGSTSDVSLLKRLHEVVAKREMPPEDEPQPSQESR